jgi:hypothetical protein
VLPITPYPKGLRSLAPCSKDCSGARWPAPHRPRPPPLPSAPETPAARAIGPGPDRTRRSVTGISAGHSLARAAQDRRHTRPSAGCLSQAVARHEGHGRRGGDHTETPRPAAPHLPTSARPHSSTSENPSEAGFCIRVDELAGAHSHTLCDPAPLLDGGRGVARGVRARVRSRTRPLALPSGPR